MNLFFTDLDNTLIYSHRHQHGDEIRWVETLNNKLQSFMSLSTYEYFLRQSFYSVVPITTRNYTQYIRLQQMAKDFGWKDALICNGAILLHNYEEVTEWSQESIRLCKTTTPFFEEAFSKCSELFGRESMVLTEHFMFYIKSYDVNGDLSRVKNLVEEGCLTILKDSRKIYVFPKILNKGTAILRYMHRSKKDWCIAAGDSEFDVPMLEVANVALCNSKIKELFPSSGNRLFVDENFSEHICEELKKISMEGVSA